MALAGHVATANAQQTPPQRKGTSVCLAWEAETSCPSAAETERAVEEMLGHRLFQGSCDLQLKAALRRANPEGWEAQLSFVREDGTVLGVRTLRSREVSCHALKNPASLVVALIAENSEPSTVLYLSDEPRPRQSSDRALRAFADLAGSRGILPGGALGSSVGVDIHLTRWLSSRADTTFWFPRSAAPGGRGGEFWAWHAGASACPSLGRPESLRASACLGLQAGVLHGSGLGLSFQQSATKAYADVEARAAVSVPLGQRLALAAFVGAAVPWLRPSFVYLDTSGATVEVHRASDVMFFAGLGLEASIFPTRGGPPTQP